MRLLCVQLSTTTQTVHLDSKCLRLILNTIKVMLVDLGLKLQVVSYRGFATSSEMSLRGLSLDLDVKLIDLNVI